MIEKRTILLDNQLVNYTIHYKNIKRCYLKVQHGKLLISTSPLFTVKDIEEFIIKNKKMILKQLNSYMIKYDYQDGGFVYIFNQKYQIVLKDIGVQKCVIHNEKIYVYHHRIQKTIENFLKDILLEYLCCRIKEYCQSDFDIKYPAIQIRKMKIRWGACFHQEQRVCFNLILVHISKDLIDYVIVHELSHFIEPNHSTRFYLEIEKRMPDYKIKEKRLKEISI